MKLDNKGKQLIQNFEGYKEKAYKCSAGVWTCGYGHTAGVTRTTTCTRLLADVWFDEDVAWAEKCVNQQNLQLTQNQFNALVSFTFNVGSSAFKSSTLLKKARRNPADSSIAAEFAKWNKARVNGTLQPIEGLTLRRAAEAQLYFE